MKKNRIFNKLFEIIEKHLRIGIVSQTFIEKLFNISEEMDKTFLFGEGRHFVTVGVPEISDENTVIKIPEKVNDQGCSMLIETASVLIKKNLILWRRIENLVENLVDVLRFSSIRFSTRFSTRLFFSIEQPWVNDHFGTPAFINMKKGDVGIGENPEPVPFPAGLVGMDIFGIGAGLFNAN